MATRPPPSQRPKENVASYPRPPSLTRIPDRIQVILPPDTPHNPTANPIILADSISTYRICETSSPPAYYIPPSDVKMELLSKNSKSTFCEWKGAASYYDVKIGDGEVVKSRIWAYEKPNKGFEKIKDHLSFYVGPWQCFIDGEECKPQPGSFYGGWISAEVMGPIKGAPGTLGW